MGDLYSKPASNNPKPQSSNTSSCPQSSRPKEHFLDVSHPTGMDQLSNATLEALSRFQGTGSSLPNSSHGISRSGASFDQPFASSGFDRVQRGQATLSATFAPTLLTNEILAAAQVGGQLTPAQLNALVAAYSQHQQQTHRPAVVSNVVHNPVVQFPQALSSSTSVSKPSSSPTSLRTSGTVSPTTGLHTSRSGSSHLSHSSVPSPFALHQKRPASRQNVFPAGHGSHSAANAVGNRPPSATQLLPPNSSHQQPRTSFQGHSGLPHVHPSGHHHHHLGESGHSDQSTGSLAHLNPVSHIQSRHHSASTPAASPSASPVPHSYQGRRPQLAPVGSHANKRPRLTNSTQLPTAASHHQPPLAHQLTHHSLSSLPSVSHIGNTSLPGGMEALMSAVVANKAMASLTSCGNFLNPAAYGSASEAAAVAAVLSPLFTATMNTNTILSVANSSGSASSVCSPNAFHGHFPVHHQRPSSTTGNNSSVTHNIQQQQQQHQEQQLLTQTYTNQLLPGSLSNHLNTGRVAYSHATPPTPSTHGIQSSVGSQQNAGIPGSMHLNSKLVHSTTGMPPMPSRLPSGHLHHPHHLGGHSTPHGFHTSSHAAPQGTHHVLLHGTLPQGSGVLRQQTKEPAYHPQVEAISPAPEESRLMDAQDAKFHREGEELLRQLDIVESDLQKQVGLERLLEKREARLASRLASTGSLSETLDSGAAASNIQPSPSTDVSPTIDVGGDFERTYENPIQAFISENRQRTRQHHLIFTRLCGPHVKASPYALPLYKQPSDLPYLCAIRAEFRQNFRPKLMRYLRRRRKAEQARLRYLAQQYAHHSTIFSKKMEKMLNSTKQRHRELRHRDIFEKALPEVKKNREDRELSMNDGPKPISSDDVEPHCQSAGGNIVDGTQTPVYDPVEEMNKMKEYAIDPPIPLAPWQRRYRFIHQAGLITDCRAQLQEEHDLSDWTDEEKQVFRERFLATPKNFLSISSYLERKTVADCIHYYYLTKKKEGYKQLLKKHTARRRRAPQSDRTGGGGGGGSHHSGAGGGSVSGGGHFQVPLSSGTYVSTISGLSAPQPSIGDPANGPTDSTKDNDHKPHRRDASSNPGANGASRTRTSRCRPAVGRQQPPSSSTDESANTKSQPANADPVADTKPTDLITQDVNPSESDSDWKPSRFPDPPSSSLPVSDLHECAEERASCLVPHQFNADKQEEKITSEPPSSHLPSQDIADLGTNCSSGEPHRCSSATHSSTDVDGTTCIKDLIHFAIEKNLTRPWSRDSTSHLEHNTELPNDRIHFLHSPIANSASGSYRGISPFTHKPTVLPELALSTRESFSSKVDVGGTHSISSGKTSFPSAPAAELYAAAAQFAAASASNEELANAMQVAAAAAAAAATAAVICGKPTDSRMLNSLSPALYQTIVGGGSQSDQRSQYSLEQSKNDELGKRWDCYPQTLKPPSNSVHQLRSWPASTASSSDADLNSTNTAILLGDFLTAQQLRRTGPPTTSAISIGTDRSLPSVLPHCRSIDPSTLPIPMGPTACSRSHVGSGSNHRPSRDLLSSMIPTASFGEYHPVSSAGSLSAEHAAWLALQAQAAVAAAAAASAASTALTNKSDCANTFARPPRSSYSPLSSERTKIGIGSPELPRENSDTQIVFSRLHKLHSSESVSEQSTPSNSIHFRRLCNLDAQVPRRSMTESLVSSSAMSTVTASAPLSLVVSTTQPSMSLPVQESSCTPELVSLNPVTYIDALIHTHLNRGSRNSDDVGRQSQPMNTSSSLITTQPKSTRTMKTLTSDLAAKSSDDMAHSVVANNTLEEQINKAIAEEIRAQIHPHVSDSAVAVSCNTDLHSMAASATTTSSGAPNQSAGIPSITSIPLKKRDRRSSLVVAATSNNSSTEHTKYPKRLSHPTDCMDLKQGGVTDPSDHTSVEESSESKIVSLARPNGIRLPCEVVGKANVDPRLKSRSCSYEDQLEPRSSDSLSSLNLLSGPKYTNTCVSTPSKPIDAIRSATVSPTSSLGDTESPGNLEIDLAACDFQPSFSAFDCVTTSSQLNTSPRCTKETV